MNDESKTNAPTVNLATEPWVKEQLMDTECRIERAFHEQTKYISQQLSDIKTEMHGQIISLKSEIHRIVFAILGIGVAIALAVFFK